MDERRRKRAKRLRTNGFVEVGNALITLILLGIVVVAGVVIWGAYTFYATGPATEDATFLVERGAGLDTVAARLENQGLIDNRFVFVLVGRWGLQKAGRIKAGEFTIPAGSSMGAILTELTEGQPNEFFVNVRPGESSFQVAQRINDPALRLSGDPVPVPPEGSVLPVRHDFFPGDNRAAILESMQEQMAAAVAKTWADCRPDVCGPEGVLKTPEELVTLASIVEKETGVDTERPLVAGLFVNRLRAGMQLQTDPTIIYGLTRGERALEGGITESQKQTETPYNTYIIPALPPGPIANPGVAALEAVAQPAETDFLYMVAVTPNKPSDGHYFAVSKAEHDANVAKYRRLESEQAAGAAPAAQ